MKFICDMGREGVRILRCFSYDGQVEIPEKIQGMEVREIGAYAFADTVRRREAGVKYLAQIREDDIAQIEEGAGGVWEWEECGCSEELLDGGVLEDGTPAVTARELISISLPQGVKKIGAYAFYLCEKLEKVSFFDNALDLGAGLFTGCLGVKELDIWMGEGERSCLKEVLAELRQTLRVNRYDKTGNIFSRLIFPEYFEESIENTPARILTLEVHGCGHRYRNAFSGTQLQYPVYDKLFAHIQVQEREELVAELALGRVRFPVQLGEERKRVYEEYLNAHGREIVKLAFRYPEEMSEILEFAGGAKWCTKACMDAMLDEAAKEGNPMVMGILMELGRRQRMAGMAGEEEAGAGEKAKASRAAKGRGGEDDGRVLGGKVLGGKDEHGGRRRRFVL